MSRSAAMTTTSTGGTSDLISPVQMVQHNENPLFLQLDENCLVGGKELPVSISTWQVHTRNEIRSEQFAKIPYSIATEEVVFQQIFD